MTQSAIEIIAEEAKLVGLDIATLRSKVRPILYFQARLAVYRRLREHGMSYNQIGMLMGGRGHWTIMRAIKPRVRQASIKKVWVFHRARTMLGRYRLRKMMGASNDNHRQQER